MIYFVRDELSGLVKIGYSENPWLRLSKMQSDCPGVLILAGIMDGDQGDEARLHLRCRAHHVRGEWFRDEGEVKAAREAASAPERTLRRSSDPRLALIADLCTATGAAGNTVGRWLDRGRVPTGYILKTVTAGVFNLDALCTVLAINGLSRSRVVPLEDIREPVSGEARSRLEAEYQSRWPSTKGQAA